MNKKALAFIPILLLVSFLVLGTIALTILKLNDNYKKNIKLGEESLKIIKIYNEAEKSQFYLEQAAEFSKEISLDIINKNMGYSKECRSQTLTNTFWNDCPSLNVENEFEMLLKENLKNYIKNYESYKSYDPLKPYDVNQEYTKLIQNLEIEVRKENNLLIISSKPVIYPIEGDTQDLPKKYTAQFVIETEYPDFFIYYKIYNKVKDCKIDKKDECISSLTSINKDIKAESIGDLIKITYKDTLIVFDIKRPLQPLGSLLA